MSSQEDQVVKARKDRKVRGKQFKECSDKKLLNRFIIELYYNK